MMGVGIQEIETSNHPGGHESVERDTETQTEEVHVALYSRSP